MKNLRTGGGGFVTGTGPGGQQQGGALPLLHPRPDHCHLDPHRGQHHRHPVTPRLQPAHPPQNVSATQDLSRQDSREEGHVQAGRSHAGCVGEAAAFI